MRSRARRPLAAALVCVSVLGVAAAASPGRPRPPELAPNVILVITDDQTVSSLAGDPPAMPWLTAQLARPGSDWWTFTDAVVTTPACCPSRATILTGRDAWATGVVDNSSGERLDAADTLATRLHDAGYRTGLVGKYLNGYPWDRAPFVPPGWDRWLAKTNAAEATTYYDYGLVDQTRWRRVGSAPADHVVDLLAREAEAFVRSAPLDRPFFLLFSPPAPHRPAVPAPLDAGPMPPTSLPDGGFTRPAKPAWLRELPPVDRAAMVRERLEERAALRSVDRALAALVETLGWRGDLDRTVIVVVSDNGFQFGERGWVGKQVPWESAIRVPLAIRVPRTGGGVLDAPVTNADLTPTLLALAGLPGSVGATGRDLLPLLRGGAPVEMAERTVRLGWPGSAEVPAWVGVRRGGVMLIRWADGSRELYDLVADPDELHDLADDPAWATRRARLEARLPAFLVPGEGDG